MKHGVTVRYGTWAALLAAMLVIGFCPAANAQQRPAVKTRSTWEVDMRRAARSIALIVARQDACKTADPRASVGNITKCDWVATQAYPKLIPRSRSTDRFYALLTDLEGADGGQDRASAPPPLQWRCCLCCLEAPLRRLP